MAWETAPRVAWIDEARCIGCARCLAPCPVDAIVGAAKHLHTVLADRCTGCELCLPPCPVDCIELRPGLPPAANQPELNRERFRAHGVRLAGRALDRQRELGRQEGHGAAAHPGAMNEAKRRALFERLRQANPEPRTELNYRSPFELLVAVVLSAQATDKSVNKATAKLFPVANTPTALLALGVRGLSPYIQSIGLYNAKAKNLIAACRLLLEKHGGEVPRTREELEELPGVGRKTANVVLNTAFGEATIAVDTHIFRVANRTGLAPGKTERAVEDKLLKFVPAEFRQDAHHWLILHGRYTCKARKPDCPACIIRDLCEYRHKTPAAPP